jgi:hypothetical protein
MLGDGYDGLEMAALQGSLAHGNTGIGITRCRNYIVYSIAWH